MIQVTDLFKESIKQPNRQFDIKVIIGDNTYYNQTIVSFEIEDNLTTGDEFTIGTAIASKLTISVRTPDIISSNAKVQVFIRTTGISWQNAAIPWQNADTPWNEVYADWVQLGEYYIDNRIQVNDVWKFTCYDKLILTQQTYISNLTYPAFMSDILNEICGQVGLEIDNSVAINHNYIIEEKPQEASMQEIIKYIASAHASSARINRSGKLVFTKFTPENTPESITYKEYVTISQTNPVKSYTRVVVTYDKDGNYLEKGTGDDDHTIKFYNPFITVSMLDDIYNSLNGFSYIPFTMDYICYPWLEVGDIVSITEIKSPKWVNAGIAWQDETTPWNGEVQWDNTVILNTKISFKGGLKATITTPSNSAQKSEFVYKGTLTQQVQTLNKTTIKENKKYYGVSTGREYGLKVEREDGASEVTLNSDKLEFLANGIPKLYFDVIEGKYKFAGDIIMEGGSISWENVGAPNATQVGAKPYDWNPSVSDVTGLNQRLTYIDGNGIYTGILTAQQINAIVGITLGANASINWGEMNKPTPEQLGVRPDTWMPNANDVGAISNTYIDQYGVFTPAVYANNLDARYGRINTALIDELIVGDNVQMGPLAYIAWGNISGDKNYNDLVNKPDIETMALNKINSTYIDQYGVWTPSVYANSINTTYGKISTAQIEDLVVGVGGNVQMGAGATISWNQVTNQPTIPSQYTNTMAVDAFESAYIDSSNIFIANVYANHLKGNWINFDNGSSITDLGYGTLSIGSSVSINLNTGNLFYNSNEVATQNWVGNQGYATQSWINQNFLSSSQPNVYFYFTENGIVVTVNGVSRNLLYEPI